MPTAFLILLVANAHFSKRQGLLCFQCSRSNQAIILDVIILEIILLILIIIDYISQILHMRLLISDGNISVVTPTFPKWPLPNTAIYE